MLDKVKLALRIKTNSFDAELNQLIAAAAIDLGFAGVNEMRTSQTDAVVIQAVITYCKMHFGAVEDYDRLKQSYDEQKAQMATATGYTDWSE